LFNNKSTKIVNKPLIYIKNDTGKTRHFTPAAQEWFNSIYAYDHNYIKSLPAADKNLLSLLKSYFNLQIKDKKIKNKRNVIKNRRLSTKRVFIGRGELKHSNNKVIITFYVYNTEAMFLWENYKKALGILYNPQKKLEISVNEDTKDKEVKSKYKPFNLRNCFNLFQYKYILRTLINKETKKENNIILFSKPIPKFSINETLEIKTLNKINNTPINTKNCLIILQKHLEKKIIRNLLSIWKKKKKIYKNIQKKYEIISFNRPLFLKHEQILPSNEDINNKRIIKLNRPFSLDEYLFQYDFKTSIDKILIYWLDIINKYYSSLTNLVERKVITNKEKSSMFNDIKKNINLALFYEEKYGFKDIVKKDYINSHLLIPLYLFKFNKTKFTIKFMEKLTQLVKNLYNKEVVFNIVNLKKMHLSSDIYTQAVALKLKNRDNKLYRVLKSSLRKIKIPDFRKINEKNNKSNKNEFIDNKIRNSLINSMFTKEDVKDPLNNLLLNFFPSAENLKKSVVKKGSVKNYSISLKDYVLMYLKHIKIRGIRVEAKGRLTRRFTASRSVFKMKWKGGLKNVDSSFRGLSTIMLRGYVKSNAQYSFISSKNRNGAFGVKGWVSNR
jgi:hypothetical protein